MDKSFIEALEQLIDDYATDPLDELISALEMKIMALKEQQDEEKDD